MTFHLEVTKPLREKVKGFGTKNLMYNVVFHTGTKIALRDFCKRIGVNYYSVHHRIRMRAPSQPDSSGFGLTPGTYQEPFKRLIADMVKRAGPKPAPCPHCNGTGRASDASADPTT